MVGLNWVNPAISTEYLLPEYRLWFSVSTNYPNRLARVGNFSISTEFSRNITEFFRFFDTFPSVVLQTVTSESPAVVLFSFTFCKFYLFICFKMNEFWYPSHSMFNYNFSVGSLNIENL